LTKRLRQHPFYSIYFDHGDRISYSNVVATKGFYGREVSNKNRLADVDIVVTSSDGTAVVLVEIEERAVTPKKVLGDVFALLMCNRFAVLREGSQRYFDISNRTALIVAGTANSNGNRLPKIKETIYPCIERFHSPPDHIPTSNVSLIFETDIRDTIHSLESKVVELLGL
jgi:hypothetical protein